jgi:hypothetical protein
MGRDSVFYEEAHISFLFYPLDNTDKKSPKIKPPPKKNFSAPRSKVIRVIKVYYPL